VINEHESYDHRSGNVMMAFGLGLIAGAVTTLLLAPASGADTRRKLNELAHQIGDKAREGADAAGQYARDAKSRLGEAVQAGREAYQRERTPV
jgi:gas vesicle protein